MSQQNVEAVKRLFVAVVGRDQAALQEADRKSVV